MKKSKSKSRKTVPKIDTSAAEFLAESQPEIVQPKPKELLLRWINLRCELDLGKELHDHISDYRRGEKGDKTFMDEADIGEILKQVGYDFTIVTTIMNAAYHGRFQNPYTVLNAIEYDGVIFDKLTDYFEKNSPEQWDLGFCELIAACNDSYMCREQCKWREDREKVRANFKSFAQGQISTTLHSDRLYAFFFKLFFGYNSAASFVLASLGDIKDDDEARLMQGLIEKGKEGVFLWDFEKYLSPAKK